MNGHSLYPKANIPLLLTSSVVAYDAGVSLKSTDDRIRLAMEGIGEWQRIAPNQPLVLCDGSNFNFSDLMRKEYPKAKIECLPFENDQEKVSQYGRSYGEGEIVRFALNHSKLIAAAGCFAKCTSKLWVDNFYKCLDEWNGRLLFKGVFLNSFSPLRKTRFAYIDTRFYIASVEHYQRYFENAHQHVGNGYSLEDSFFDVVQAHQLSHLLLCISPVISGVGGGTGRYYKNTPIRLIKETLRVRLLAMHPTYRTLFSAATD